MSSIEKKPDDSADIFDACVLQPRLAGIHDDVIKLTGRIRTQAGDKSDTNQIPSL